MFNIWCTHYGYAGTLLPYNTSLQYAEQAARIANKVGVAGSDFVIYDGSN